MMTRNEKLAQLRDDLRSFNTSLGTSGRSVDEDRELKTLIKHIKEQIELLETYF